MNARTAVAYLCIAIAGSVSLGAQEGWSARIGAGVAGAPVYEGSREYIAAAVPDVEVEWSRGGFSCAASTMDGIGATVFDATSGILAQVSVNVGASREADWDGTLSIPGTYDERTRRDLAGTPDVTETYTADLTVGRLTPVGIVGAAIGYRPIRVDDAETDHGFLVSALYLVAFPVTDRLSVEAVALLDFMNERYADAWYSLDDDTERLSRFDASAGVRLARTVIGVDFMMTDHLGFSGQLSGTVRLGDAADSPYTFRRSEGTLVLSTYYSIKQKENIR